MNRHTDKWNDYLLNKTDSKQTIVSAIKYSVQTIPTVENSFEERIAEGESNDATLFVVDRARTGVDGCI